MTTSQNGSHTFIDYFSAIQRFLAIAAKALPEMQVRRQPAGWVLANWQMRVRERRSAFTYQRNLNLESAQLSVQGQLAIYQSVLVELQTLQRRLTENRSIPATKVPQVVEILARYPVINVRQMAENAQVSEATAKRWLKAMTHDWLVEEKYVNGQNQYLNRELLAIIDDHARR
jgi:uncharacterized protein YigA (DUF484 family)